MASRRSSKYIPMPLRHPLKTHAANPSASGIGETMVGWLAMISYAPQNVPVQNMVRAARRPAVNCFTTEGWHGSSILNRLPWALVPRNQTMGPPSHKSAVHRGCACPHMRIRFSVTVPVFTHTRTCARASTSVTKRVAALRIVVDRPGRHTDPPPSIEVDVLRYGPRANRDFPDHLDFELFCDCEFRPPPAFVILLKPFV